MNELIHFLIFTLAAYGLFELGYDVYVYSSSSRLRRLAYRLLDVADRMDS